MWKSTDTVGFTVFQDVVLNSREEPQVKRMLAIVLNAV